MANAKKLTEPQIIALRALAGGPTYTVRLYTTIDALWQRGLIEFVEIRGIGPNGGETTDHRWTITPAGRHALFEATGENAAPPDPRPYVRARLAAGLQANGRPAGHGGGCRCDECKAVEGP